MSEVAFLHLIVAAFDGETAAEEALKTLKESREEKLVGIQAAITMHKDEKEQIHFKDVGLSPGKGALGGVVLGAAVGILTGGTGLALGAVGALVGGLVGKRKRLPDRTPKPGRHCARARLLSHFYCHGARLGRGAGGRAGVAGCRAADLGDPG
jgi:hypothetical protein